MCVTVQPGKVFYPQLHNCLSPPKTPSPILGGWGNGRDEQGHLTPWLRKPLLKQPKALELDRLPLSQWLLFGVGEKQILQVPLKDYYIAGRLTHGFGLKDWARFQTSPFCSLDCQEHPWEPSQSASWLLEVSSPWRGSLENCHLLKMWLGPDQPPTETKGSAQANRWVLNERPEFKGILGEIMIDMAKGRLIWSMPKEGNLVLRRCTKSEIPHLSGGWRELTRQDKVTFGSWKMQKVKILPGSVMFAYNSTPQVSFCKFPSRKAELMVLTNGSFPTKLKQALLLGSHQMK